MRRFLSILICVFSLCACTNERYLFNTMEDAGSDGNFQYNLEYSIVSK